MKPDGIYETNDLQFTTAFAADRLTLLKLILFVNAHFDPPLEGNDPLSYLSRVLVEGLGLSRAGIAPLAKALIRIATAEDGSDVTMGKFQRMDILTHIRQPRVASFPLQTYLAIDRQSNEIVGIVGLVPDADEVHSLECRNDRSWLGLLEQPHVRPHLQGKGIEALMIAHVIAQIQSYVESGYSRVEEAVYSLPRHQPSGNLLEECFGFEYAGIRNVAGAGLHRDLYCRRFNRGRPAAIPLQKTG